MNEEQQENLTTQNHEELNVDKLDLNEEVEVITRQDIEARIITKAWKNETYKQELIANPKEVVGEAFGVKFDQEVNITVLEETPNSLHFVLPMSPMQIATELSEDELEEIAGGLHGRHRRRRSNAFVLTAAGALTVGFAGGAIDVQITRNITK